MQSFDFNNHIFQTDEEKNNFLTQALWSNPGFMYIKDIHLKYIICNMNFAQAAGLNHPNEILGLTDYDLAWGATEAKQYHADDIEILKGQSKLNYECLQLQCDGHTKTILANKIPFYNDEGAIIGIIGNYIDITERKKIETALTQEKSHADNANKIKSELVANVSHDLRTPLSAILGMTEAAILSQDPALYLETLEGVLESGQHLLGLIEDILNYSSVQHSTLQKPTAFILAKFLNGIRLSTESNATQKGLQFIIDNQCNPNQMIYADKTALRRIVINLLGNAIKFTTKGSVTLTISQGPPSEYAPELMTLHITVSDTGKGIADDDLEKIFDPFARLSATEINSQQSTGLGLAITQQLLLQMSGTISVVSSVGKGTTFHCKIPIQFSDILTTDNDQHNLNQTLKNDYGRPLKILVVEDVKPVRRAMRMLLNLIDAESTFAFNGEEAIQIPINEFDIVFMDLGLGGISGIEATKILREKHGSSVPIVALTAHASEKDKAHCLASGMQGFLTKPVSIHALKAMLQELNLL